MRRVLNAASLLNVAGAILFGFPGSFAGRLAGLPGDVPILYRALVAFLVLLLAGLYAWLARQATIDRAMVTFGALGKAGAFGIVVLLFLHNDVALRFAIVMAADLLFAATFAIWLLGRREGGGV